MSTKGFRQKPLVFKRLGGSNEPPEPHEPPEPAMDPPQLIESREWFTSSGYVFLRQRIMFLNSSRNFVARKP